ncbi:LysR family transcriptional regulator [Rugamonas brunnea]|nr:LysR family transcriptional regulator [Rugamonas brunnea]
MSLKLRQLSHLVLLADELHFARAAERAFLSQSAFSRSIGALEEETGMRLFDRGPHFVSPTPAGQHVIDRARRLLSSSHDLSREIAMLRSGDLGNIAVGAGPFSGIALMPSALAELRRRHPRVQAKLVISDAWSLLQQLRDEKLDFFLAEMQGIPANELLAVKPLGRLTGAFFCRAAHPLANQSGLRLADLAGASFVAVHMPTELRRVLGKLIAADEHGELPIAVECESLAILREFVLASDVVLVATERAMQMELAAGTIRKLQVLDIEAPGEPTPLATNFGMVSLRDRTPTTASNILMGLVQAEAAKVLAPASN